MAILRWFLGFLITVAVATVAVMNTGSVEITYSPVHEAINLPIYLILLLPMAFGFLFGGAVVWLNMGKLRRDRRQKKREIKILEKEVSRLQKEQQQQELSVIEEQQSLSA